MTGYELWVSRLDQSIRDDVNENVGSHSEYFNAISNGEGWPWRGGLLNVDDMAYILECMTKRHRNVLFVMKLKDYGTCEQSMLRALNGKSELVPSYMVEFPDPSDELLDGYDGNII